MADNEKSLPAAWRIRLAMIGMTAGIALLVAGLFRVQVLNGVIYARRYERQSLRRVRLPGVRGRIFDRNGVCLADNRPSYCVAVYAEELRRSGPWSRTVESLDREVDRLSALMRLPREIDRADIAAHVRSRLPVPLLAWTDLDSVALSRLLERIDRFPAVDVYVRPARRYPFGSLAAHTIGYVGRDRPRYDEDEEVHFYEPDMRGRAGLEKQFDALLAGRPGGRLLRVDARGYKHDVLAERDPVPGASLNLTLDSRIQRVAESVITGKRAAVVLLDPRNGEVLAMASAPAYDLNAMVPAPSSAFWRALLADPARPLVNRAIGGAYPPGSTFKPLVAMAGMMTPGVSGETRFECTGEFSLGGGVVMRCWKRAGHGVLAMRKSLEQSCNPYYYQLALHIGYDRIQALADAVGFGRKTGISLEGERAGLLPDGEWKRRTRHEGWWPGDTCNVAIGQGALLATPLQMAVMAGALANGGIVYRPRLRAGSGPGEVARKLAWNDARLAPVRGGMYDVVQAPSGTGGRARVEGWEMAGKTGTAQYGPPSARKHYGWMIGFAPFDDPRYAIAVVVEDADSGGLSAGPVVQKIMTFLSEMRRNGGDRDA